MMEQYSTATNGLYHQQRTLTDPVNMCAGCDRPIVDQYLLKALERYWHEDCLKCGCCGCRLGEVGSTLYTRANLILCKRDYLRLFGTSGSCAACTKVIPAFEMVMRAKTNVYHLDCFACQQCHQRFCVGDRFYLCDNRILCEYDYDDRIGKLQSAIQSQRAMTDVQPGLGIDHQQQQLQGDGSSSGYGSPDSSVILDDR